MMRRSVMLQLCWLLGAFVGVQSWAVPTQSSFVGDRIQTRQYSASASSTSLMMKIPVVDQWRVLKNGAVVGVVKNHPTIRDGDTITTSPLKAPASATARGLVETRSGSKYRLGTPKNFPNQQAGQQRPPEVAKQAASVKEAVRKPSRNKTPARAASKPEKSPTTPPVPKPATQNTVDLREKRKRAKVSFDLTGVTVGDYLLAGKVARSTSGKSKLWCCYKGDDNAIPVGQALMIKVSPNLEALERESKNYERVTSGLTRGQFVDFIEYLPQAGKEKDFAKQGAIVLEKGDLDLKAYIANNGPLNGRMLRNTAVAAVQCLQAVHSCSLVWTDLKTENFVVKMGNDQKSFDVKGIDLESAMPYQDNPVDYSPEACPPEFADAFLAGEGPYFLLDYSYDVWSLGMMLYEISTGRSAFEGKSPSQITKILKSPGYEVDVSAVPDQKLRDLIASCLKTEPKDRLSIPQVLLHPYFLTTGLGPFSF